MKRYRMLAAFFAIMVSVSLACGSISFDTSTTIPTPTSAPVLNPTPDQLQVQPPEPPVSSPSAGNDSGFVTVEDQNKLFVFEIPGDWTYEANDLGNAIYSDVYMYSDTWTSPDGSGVIESISGRSEGFDFDGTTSTYVTLDLLNTYYSSTGREGDIRVSSTSTAQDGSTRLDWKSTGGDYSGISWFEIRGNRTFLMWTVDWGNAADQSVLDILDHAINTYQIQTQ
ncbi:MAG: hypothetical protein FJZ87_03995 [Chloroflexi bacterium]|nr:hypothetical protein [Chloroflexota bacterium]